MYTTYKHITSPTYHSLDAMPATEIPNIHITANTPLPYNTLCSTPASVHIPFQSPPPPRNNVRRNERHNYLLHTLRHVSDRPLQRDSYVQPISYTNIITIAFVLHSTITPFTATSPTSYYTSDYPTIMPNTITRSHYAPKDQITHHVPHSQRKITSSSPLQPNKSS